MEKKPRKTKVLKSKVENKEFAAAEEVVEQNVIPELDNKGMYEFVANGTFRTLPKGTIWKVTGEIAKIFLQRGYGKLK